MGPEADIYARLSTFDAFTATGAALYQGEPKPDAVTPWAAYQVEEIEPSSPELNSSGQLFRHALTISMSADSYAELRTLHDAVRAALDQFSGGQVAYCGYDRADLSYTDEAQKNRMGVIEFTVVCTEALILPVESGTPMVEVRQDGLYFDGEKLGAGSELPENLAYTNVANTFTETQTINGQLAVKASGVTRLGTNVSGQVVVGSVNVDDYDGLRWIHTSGGNGVLRLDAYGGLHCTSADPYYKPLTVKGATSQVADLTQWQTSTGAVVVAVGTNFGGTTGNIQFGDTGGALRVCVGLDSANNFFARNGATSGDAYYGNSLSSNTSGNVYIQTAGANAVTIHPSRNLSINSPETHTGVEVRLGSVYNAYPGVYSTSSACLVGESGITILDHGTGSTIFTQSGWRVTPGSGATYAMRWDDTAGTEIATLTPGGGFSVTSGAGGTGFTLTPSGNNYSYTLNAGNSGTGVFGMASNTTVSFTDGIQTPLQVYTNYYAATPTCNVNMQGVVTVTGLRPANVVLTVKGAASQNEDLQRWVDSTGSTRARVDNAGGASFIGNLSVGGNSGSPGNNYIDVMAFGGNGWWRLYSKYNAGVVTFDLTSNNSGYTPFSANANGTTAAYGVWTHEPNSAASVPLVVKEAASQTADALQVQDSTGAAYVRINQNGGGDRSQISLIHGAYSTRLFTYTGGAAYLDTSDRPFYIRTNGSNNILTVNPYGVRVDAVAATDVPLTCKGTTSQTGDLQQWQTSTSAVVASVRPDGMIYAVQAGTTGMTYGFDGTFIGLQRTGAGAGQIVAYDTTTGDTVVNSSFSAGTGVKLQSMGTTAIYVQQNKIGFFGASPVIQPTALTAADNSPIVTADIDTNNAIETMRLRLEELEYRLQLLGLLA